MCECFVGLAAGSPAVVLAIRLSLPAVHFVRVSWVSVLL